jgi:endonuclease/exonuclease/phosphatase family metal-dependent hydrolase
MGAEPLSSAGQHHRDSPGQLRVLHWNIHSWHRADGGSNLDAVSDLIRQTAPHVVSLTEVDERWGTAAYLQELADRNGYSWLFTPSFEFGSDMPKGGFGNALLTALPILAAQHWQLLWPPRLYDGTEPSEPRSVTFARLEFLSEPLWVGTTHMPREDSRGRADALERLVALTRRLSDRWLVCGDFNTPASSWLDDDHSFGVCPDPPEATYPAIQPVEPIDYCIASPDVRLDAEVLIAAGSDHLPQLVIARLGGDR